MCATHVRRTSVRRTCTAYMYHSVNTLLGQMVRVRVCVKVRVMVSVSARFRRTVGAMAGETD